MNIAVMDCYFGDAGKARIANYFSKDYDFLVRAASSSNCGHTFYVNNKKYVHHLLPSADYRYSRTKSFLGSGMVINPEELLSEVLEARKDFPEAPKSIYVDPDAFLIKESHIELDKQNNKHIGSTNKGVGPAYTEKISRKGTRIYNLINDNAEVIQKLKALGVNFVPVLAMKKELEKSSILFEGAQSTLLDINFGIYPFVTSCETTISSIHSAGFGFVKLDKVYGVIKPYGTKSGEGPMPTEDKGSFADKIVELGKEFGSTTGRRRRIGYLDLPACKYGILKGGITDLIYTKLDILNGFEKVVVCNDYGKEIYSPNDFNDINPKYIEMPGWDYVVDKDNRIHPNVKKFLNYTSEYLQTNISHISFGVSEKDIIKL
jgi:adenylosuccinate synthase